MTATVIPRSAARGLQLLLHLGDVRRQGTRPLLRTGDELFDIMCQLEANLKAQSFFVMDENFLLDACEPCGSWNSWSDTTRPGPSISSVPPPRCGRIASTNSCGWD